MLELQSNLWSCVLVEIGNVGGKKMKANRVVLCIGTSLKKLKVKSWCGGRCLLPIQCVLHLIWESASSKPLIMQEPCAPVAGVTFVSNYNGTLIVLDVKVIWYSGTRA